MKFRVLVGKHSEGGVLYGKGEPAGDIVDSKSNLIKHNRENSIKFERLDEEEEAPVKAKSQAAPAPTAAPAVKQSKPEPLFKDQKEYHAALEKMSEAELKAHADAEEIDLKGAKKRDDMLRIIKAG